jgi:hypothetical protein
VPHHGQRSRTKALSGRSRFENAVELLAGLRVPVGVIDCPTHRPKEIGSDPASSVFSRRTRSAAQIVVADRWNCCVVSRVSVYLLMIAVPAPAGPEIVRRLKISNTATSR